MLIHFPNKSNDEFLPKFKKSCNTGLLSPPLLSTYTSKNVDHHTGSTQPCGNNQCSVNAFFSFYHHVGCCNPPVKNSRVEQTV